MAIHAYVGLPGHGKSYGVVEHVIIPSLKQNRHVVTNIPLMVDELLMDFGGQITQLGDDWYQLQDLSEVAPNGCVLVLDELWSRWPSGLKQEDLSYFDSDLLTKHRHRVDDKGKSMRIVLVTQDLSQIASSVRILVETTYKMTKLTKKRFRVDIYKGVIKGEKPPRSSLIRQTLGAFKPEVYCYYKSATQSQTGEVGDESVADGRGSLFKNGSIWTSLIGFLICFVVAIFLLKSFFLKADEKPAIEPVAEVKQAKPTSKITDTDLKEPSRLERIAQPATVQNAPSTLWRVGAYWGDYSNPEKMQVLLVNINKIKRQVPFKDYCKFIDGGNNVSCLVDGELVTSWSGSGVVTQSLDPSSILTN